MITTGTSFNIFRLMKLIIIQAVCLISLFAFSSYGQYLYVPGSLNMPLATNKGEIKGTASLGNGGVELQGSYCIDSHMVVCINGMYGSRWASNTSGTVGCGYYTSFSSRGRFEIMGGGGYGVDFEWVEWLTYPGQLVEVNAKLPRVFVQADLGYVKNHVELGFGIRVSEIFYRGTVTTSLFGAHDSVISKTTNSLAGQELFLEPCIMVSFGGKNIKVHLSAGLSGMISGYEFRSYDILPTASLGVTFNILRKRQ